MREKKRIPTSDEPFVWKSPFAALKDAGLPAVRDVRQGDRSDEASKVPAKNRGRVDILRQTAHRGGKTVTVVTGFTGIGLAEKEQLAKEMQTACGAGGRQRGPDRDSGRSSRGSRPHPDPRRLPACICRRVTGPAERDSLQPSIRLLDAALHCA